MNEKQNIAKKFFRNLKETFNKHKEEIKDNYYNKTANRSSTHSTPWTTCIQYLTEKTIKDCNVSREYYRVDSLAYEYIDISDKLDFEVEKNYVYIDQIHYLKLYNWKVKYAIEYENKWDSWLDELVKLSHLRTDLKIIICYSEYTNDEDYLKLINDKLSIAKELLNLVEPDSLNDNWLIVFGPCKDVKKIDGYDNVQKLTSQELVDKFVGFTLNTDNKKFEQI